MVVWFGPVKRKRTILFVSGPPCSKGNRLLVAVQILPCVDHRSIGKPVRVDVVTAASKVVVRIPGVGGGKHGDLRARFRRRYYPRKGECAAGWSQCPEIVQPTAFGRDDGRLRRVAVAVPFQPRLREVAIGKYLPVRLRAMLVKPADHPDKLSLNTVTPEGELILFHRVNAELGDFTGTDPLRQHVAE